MSNHTKNLILIVDDSPDTLNMLNQALEKENMETLVALDGYQVINIASKMRPDIILLDASMPEMDGFEVCRRLKNNPMLNSIPVIFMTGLSDSEHVVMGFQVGGIDYVTKPIIHSELVARIQVHITNNRATLSAQSTLNIAAQTMFSVDTNGSIVWASPDTQNLFKAATTENDDIPDTVKSTLMNWISKAPDKGTTLSLRTRRSSFTFLFLGCPQSDEYLFRITDSNLVNETLILQKNLHLTNREAEVLSWIAKGKANAEIGQTLETSPRTINKHCENIYRKINVENRTTAAAKALQCLRNL